MTTTFYRDNVVHISSGGVRVDSAWYPLDSLTYIWHRRTGRLRHGSYMLATRGGAVLVIIGLLVAAGLAARKIDFGGDQQTMYIAGGILGVIVIGGDVAVCGGGVRPLPRPAHDPRQSGPENWVLPTPA